MDVVRLGRVGYAEALELQRRLAGAKRRGELRADLLLLVEHPPVVTLGRGARQSNVALSKETLEARGVTLVEIERGGDVTYHGPGQLVGYPILDLGRFRRDLHWYLRRLEAAVIGALGRSGLEAFRVQGFTGVWVGDPGVTPPGPARSERPAGAPREAPAPAELSREEEARRVPGEEAAALIASGSIRKIASIGVHASRWITRHGFALNVTDEPLESFRWIVPCGIDGVRMTSMRSEGARTSLAGAAEAVVAGFAEAFDARVVPRDGPPRVPAAGPRPPAGAEPLDRPSGAASRRAGPRGM